jgi:hypothetical protein
LANKRLLIKQPSEEDPDEGIRDLVEIALKKMVGCVSHAFGFANQETFVFAIVLG